MCPVDWAMRLQAFHNRRDPQSPYFLSRDQRRPYTYGAALSDFKARQLRVGVAEGDLSGLHGLRVAGYNLTKRGLGEELTVAHGLWRSTAHRRYERFAMSQILRIPSVIAGADDG
eukprot:7230479-Prymnesium_polylepis.1